MGKWEHKFFFAGGSKFQFHVRSFLPFFSSLIPRLFLPLRKTNSSDEYSSDKYLWEKLWYNNTRSDRAYRDVTNTRHSIVSSMSCGQMDKQASQSKLTHWLSVPVSLCQTIHSAVNRGNSYVLHSHKERKALHCMSAMTRPYVVHIWTNFQYINLLHDE